MKGRLLVIVAGFAGACMGQIGGESTVTGDPGTGAGGDIGLASGAGGSSLPPVAPLPTDGLHGTACRSGPLAPQRLWRMSNAQYGNAVRDLLGLANAPVISGGISPHAFFTPGGERVSSQLAFEYARATGQALMEFAPRRGSVAGCAAGVSEDVCARDFITSFGTRAFRRPLGAEESADLLAIFNEGRKDGFNAGIDLVIAALLQAPSFIYRVEVGTPIGPDAARLSSYEVGAQLSFLFLDSLPDPGLWAAAASGSLDTDAGVTAEVDRLLADPRVRKNLSRIVLASLGASQVLGAEKDEKVFPGFTPEVRASLYKETDLFVQDLLWQGGGRLVDLHTSNRTFVDRGLAQLYGVPYTGGQAGGFVPVTLPADRRSGVLTQGSFLAARAGLSQTSVVHRGLFLHGDVLCLPAIPSPPAALQAEVAAASSSPKTEQEKAADRAAKPACRVCHAQFDPFGLLFERYDAIGSYRTSIAGKTLDPAVELSVTPLLSGRIGGAVDLIRRMAAAPELGLCVSYRMLMYAIGDEALDRENCGVKDAHDTLASSDGNLVSLFRAVGVSPSLRVRRVGGTP